MSRKAKIQVTKYVFCAVFVALLAWLYFSFRDFSGATVAQKYMMIADALTIPGVILVMVGCLLWLSNLGALDGIGYAVSFAIRMLIPGKRVEADEKYADYLERKRANRLKGYGFLFVSGAVTMAVAAVFIVLYYTAA